MEHEKRNSDFYNELSDKIGERIVYMIKFFTEHPDMYLEERRRFLDLLSSYNWYIFSSGWEDEDFLTLYDDAFEECYRKLAESRSRLENFLEELRRELDSEE